MKTQLITSAIAATLFAASVGATDIEETFRAPLPDNNESGGIAELSLTRDLPAGSSGLSLDHSIETTGERSILQVERMFEWPTGELALEAGVANNPTGNVEPIGGLELTKDIPTGQLTAFFSRSFSTSSDDQDVQITKAGLGYDFIVNDLSQLAFGLDFSNIKDRGTGTGDVDRVSLTATYSRKITEDLDLSVGYGYDYFDTETTSPAHNNRVFISLVRGFEIRR